MKKNTGWIVALGILLALSVALGAMFFLQKRDAERTLHIVYDRAFQAAAGTMEDVSLSLEKLTFCRTGRQSAKLLERVSRGADCVLKELSVLPAAGETLPEVLSFANRLSEYADALNRKATGEELSAEDWAQLEGLAAQGQRLSDILQNTDAESIARVADTEGETDLYADFVSEDEPAITLLYDGAFSDAAKSAPKNLGSGEISAQEAGEIAVQFIGSENASAKSEGESGGEIPCTLIGVTDGENVYHVQVTKTGKVYLMAAENVSGEAVLSVEECKEKATDFLREKGFSEMEPSFAQTDFGVVTINFVATQNGVWLYPDQVKVQISAHDGRIVGFEANNYLRNHTEREFPEEILSENELENLISAFEEVKYIRLCVIPHFEKEIFCYEIRGTKGGETYQLYLNAETGDCEDILKIVADERGEGVS